MVNKCIEVNLPAVAAAILSVPARYLVAPVAIALSLFAGAPSAWATIIPPGPHTFDGNLPGTAFVDYTGTKFATPAIAPTNNFGVSIDSGLYVQNYPGSNFHIDSGFGVTSSFVFDANANSIIDAGDSIFSVLGPGTFDFRDPSGVIVSGNFTSAGFNSSIGATAGSLSTSSINGLVLTPGPAFTFTSSFVSVIAAAPTGFNIGLSFIPGGVAATPAGPGFGPFLPATLRPFAFSSGSANISGNMTVVPEPSTVVLFGLGAIGLFAVARRRRAA